MCLNTTSTRTAKITRKGSGVIIAWEPNELISFFDGTVTIKEMMVFMDELDAGVPGTNENSPCCCKPKQEEQE